MQPTTFWNRYKVFILGLIGSIGVALNQLLSNGSQAQDIKVYAYAALMAAMSYIATEWRGKGVSIVGILGTLAATFVSLQTSGNFTWNQFLTYGIVSVLAVVSPPPKPSTYEHNEVIVQAKEVPPVNQIPDPPNVTDLPKKQP